MKYAYVTVLSTNSYFEGVLVLFESLKLTNPKYDTFVVLVNDEIDKKNIDELIKRDYEVIKKPKINVDVNNKNFKYWANTFDKINVFGLYQFDKIVYLDSDMYIKNNIDELFLLPHMSGAIAGKGVYKEWDGINSGLMVIVPEKDLDKKILNVLYEHKFDKDIGDQDLIEYYYNWKDQNLAISEKYNLFYNFSDYYINLLNYKVEDISVIHFIGSIKPWMYDKNGLIKYRIECQLNKDRKYELYFFDKYIELLKKVCKKM